MKKAKRVTALALSFILLLCGCANGTTDDKDTEKEEVKQEETASADAFKYKLDEIVPSAYGNASGLNLEPGAYISIIGKSSEGAYWEEVKAGVKQAAADINAELGYEGGDKVKVTFSAPEEVDNVDEQVSLLDEELARYPIALGISIADDQACDVQFDIAIENNIPVVAFDSGSDYEGLMAKISTDNGAAGKFAAKQFAEMLGGEGKVLMLIHESNSEAAREREKGFKKVIKDNYENIEILDVIHLDDLDDLRYEIADQVARGDYELEGLENLEGIENISKEDIMDYLLAKYPEVTGCYTTNEASGQLVAGGLERLEEEDVCVVSFDAGNAQVESLQNGQFDGLVIQNPFGMGYAAVIAAARAGLQLGNEAFVNTGYTWVDRDNMDNEDIKNLLY